MTLLHISELADRSGVPSSTLRYYERIGLVEPLGRADNGYRIYDDTTVERVAFIGRAKRLGMSLDDVATLVEAWVAGECEPLQDRLRDFLTGRIRDLRRRIAEDAAFERQLERILAGLDERPAVEGPCRSDCGCDSVESDDAGGPAIACTLAGGDMEQRIVEWQQILGTAKATERSVGRARAVFDPSAGLIAELARLCAAETACCPFFTFGIEIAAATVILTVEAPADADEMIGSVFDAGTERPRSPIGG